MKLFDWIVLLISVPMFLLNFIGYIIACSRIEVAAGIAEPKAKPRDIVFWLAWILFIIYRQWG